jgi:hypothetical protein
MTETLHAQWNAIEYTITLVTTGTSVSNPTNYTIGVAQTRVLPATNDANPFIVSYDTAG